MTNKTEQQAVPVAQEDREAARWNLIWCASGLEGKYAREVGEGLHDHDEPVQAFARHRVDANQTREAEGEEAAKQAIVEACAWQSPEECRIWLDRAITGDFGGHGNMIAVETVMKAFAIRAALNARGGA